MVRPLLLVDVDGVISLFGFDPAAPPPGAFRSVDGVPHFISASAGPRLRRLIGAFDPVWCTGWEEKANEHLPALLGLAGPLPYLSFDRALGRANTHWKLGPIEDHAGPERPLAWIDDAFDLRCETWAAVRPGPTLLVRTDPAAGLLDHHVEQLLDFSRAQRAQASKAP
jgi:hypothetical protein